MLALKILEKQTIIEMRQTRNVQEEKDLITRLKHTFVLQLFGTFQDADNLYLMLEVGALDVRCLPQGDGPSLGRMFYLLKSLQHLQCNFSTFRVQRVMGCVP